MPPFLVKAKLNLPWLVRISQRGGAGDPVALIFLMNAAILVPRDKLSSLSLTQTRQSGTFLTANAGIWSRGVQSV